METRGLGATKMVQISVTRATSSPHGAGVVFYTKKQKVFLPQEAFLLHDMKIDKTLSKF